MMGDIIMGCGRIVRGMGEGSSFGLLGSDTSESIKQMLKKGEERSSLKVNSQLKENSWRISW